jgi:hypothetical protein
VDQRAIDHLAFGRPAAGVVGLGFCRSRKNGECKDRDCDPDRILKHFHSSKEFRAPHALATINRPRISRAELRSQLSAEHQEQSGPLAGHPTPPKKMAAPHWLMN